MSYANISHFFAGPDLEVLAQTRFFSSPDFLSPNMHKSRMMLYNKDRKYFFLPTHHFVLMEVNSITFAPYLHGSFDM